LGGAKAGLPAVSPRASSAGSSCSKREGRSVRILVTGHRGYIGSARVPIVQAAGHEVDGLDSDLYAGCTFGDPAAVPDIPEVGRDIRDVPVEALAGIDAIFHLAALSNDP